MYDQQRDTKYIKITSQTIDCQRHAAERSFVVACFPRTLGAKPFVKKFNAVQKWHIHFLYLDIVLASVRQQHSWQGSYRERWEGSAPTSTVPTSHPDPYYRHVGYISHVMSCHVMSCQSARTKPNAAMNNTKQIDRPCAACGHPDPNSPEQNKYSSGPATISWVENTCGVRPNLIVI